MEKNIAMRAALPDPEWQKRKRMGTEGALPYAGFHDITDEEEDHPPYPMAGVLKRQTMREIRAQQKRHAAEAAAGSRAAELSKQFGRNPMSYPEYDEQPACPVCGGPGMLLGSLGTLNHYRCRNCGWDWSKQKTNSNPVYQDVSNAGRFSRGSHGFPRRLIPARRGIRRIKAEMFRNKKRSGSKLSAAAKKKISNYIKRKTKGKKVSAKIRGKLLAAAMALVRGKKAVKKSRKNSMRTRLVSVKVVPTQYVKSGKMIKGWKVQWRTANMQAPAFWYYATKSAALAAAARLRGGHGGGGMKTRSRTRTRTRTKSKRNVGGLIRQRSRRNSYKKKSRSPKYRKKYSSKRRYVGASLSKTPMQKIYSRALEIRAAGSVNSGSNGIKKSTRFVHKFSSKPGIYGVVKSGCYRLRAGSVVLKGARSLFRKYGAKSIARPAH